MVTYSKWAKEFTMEHEVQDGPISIVRIVNSCLYWVRCSNCFTLADIDENLKSSNLKTANDIKRGDKVVVRLFDDRYCRGIVQNPVQEKIGKEILIRYKVFLVDMMDNFIVEPKMLLRVENTTAVYELPQQLHLVGIQFGIPTTSLESEFQMDEKMHNKFQRNTIFKYLINIESVEFYSKLKRDSVTFGKFKLFGQKYENLLRVLIEKNLAQYHEHFMSVLNTTGGREKTKMELEKNKELLSPSPIIDSSPSVSLSALPPPPEVVIDKELAAHCQLITNCLGSSNPLDRIVPFPKVESFEEMNRRYQTISKFDAMSRKKTQTCGERKFEYTTSTSFLVGKFVDLEMNRNIRIYPPSSTSEDYASSSAYSSSQEIESGYEDTSYCESEVPRSHILEKTSTQYNYSEDCSNINKNVGKQVDTENNGNNGFDHGNNGFRHRNHSFPTKVNFGRGKVFLECLSKSDRVSPLSESEPSALGQFDDVSEDPLGVFKPFDPDSESVKDFIDGFLDETSDSFDELYEDRIRMNKQLDSSPIATRPDNKKCLTASPSLPHQSPVPLETVRSEELSSEESVSSVATSQCSNSKSNFSLPDVLRINRNRILSHRKSNDDSSDSSSHELCPAQRSFGCLNQEKLGKETPLTGNYGDGGMPRRSISMIGRGKVFLDRNASQAYGKPLEGEMIRKNENLTHSSPYGISVGRGATLERFSSFSLSTHGKVNNRSDSQTNKSTQSRKLIVRSTPGNSEVDAETELDLSSVKRSSSLENSFRGNQLEMALKKMSIQADPDPDSSESESLISSEPLVKPLLKEFVDETVKQELTSTSDGEEDSGKEGALALDNSDNFMVKISRSLNSEAGLLHGATDIRPAEFLSNLDIDELIYNNAKNYGVHRLTSPQYFGIPAILKMRNVVFVAPNRTKKSSAFVIPLMSLLMNDTYYSKLRKGNGPRCVFVAPTSERVKMLGKLCARYCGAKLTTITTFGGGLELERKNELAAGCDILITTPRCWLRLLQYPTVTNLSRICHLVLDRFDILADLFSPELKQISAKISSLMEIRTRKNEAFSSLAVQMVISAEQWSPAVEDVATKLLNKPVVIFVSHIEAILYSGIRPRVTIVTKEAKNNKLLGLVQTYWSKKKIVVFCATPGEVTEVRKACSAQSIPIVAHENMAKSLISGVNAQWCSSKQPPMLICTDNVLSELGIFDAQVLIHFSLPENKSSFSERFVVFHEHLPDRILHPEAPPPNCIVHIIFDESREAPFPFMVDFLRRINVKIPAQVIDVVKAIERKKEEEKTSGFCENILQLGYCYKMSSCKSRHVVLAKLDRPRNGQVSKGLIKVQIIHVHSAVKYSARILAHNPNLCGSGPWTRYKSEFAVLNFKMGSYFASPRNRRMHGRPKVDDIVAYQEELDRSFFRARVVKITKRNDHQEPMELEIFLMDEGIEKKSLTHTLYELPEELKKYPDQAIFVYLANLKPVDLDTAWSFAGKRLIDKAIHNSEIEDVDNQDIICKVLFTIGNNCIVENLRWYRQLTYSQCFTLDLRQLLLNSGCGLDNPEYSETLAEICASGNLEFGLNYRSENSNTPSMKIISKKEEKEPPRWAHLSYEEDLILVNTVIEESPSLFYIKLKRFAKTLAKLETELSDDLNERKEVLKEPKVGDVCVAENPGFVDNSPMWNRCIILDIFEEKADIFFVDYGDTRSVPISSLFSIPWKYVIRLPFQAIECKLAGVVPTYNKESGGTEWTEEAIAAFQNHLTFEENGFGEFYVKVMDLDLKARRTGGRCYHVILLNFDGDVPLVFNKKFVEMGFGSPFSLDIDESELADAFKQIKELEKQDSVDDDDWDVECPSEVNGKALPTDSFPLVLAEDTENSKSELLPFNFDEVDSEELQDFLVGMGFEDIGFLRKRAAVTEGPGDIPRLADEADGIPKQLPDTSSSKEQMEEDGQDVQGFGPVWGDGVDRPLMVRCAPFKTPLIHWRQDKNSVTIKYMIPCLQLYKGYINLVSVAFSGIVDNDCQRDEYWKRINLFGPVVPNSVSEKLTITCLRVTILKRVQGYLWPRLTYGNTRDHRIKLDPEDENLEVIEDSKIIDEYYETGYEMTKSQRHKKKDPDEILPSKTYLVESSSEDDDDEDDFYEPDDDADPYNPLS